MRDGKIHCTLQHTRKLQAVNCNLMDDITVLTFHKHELGFDDGK